MKALTVWQPSAWAIVAGIKDVENRSRETRFRGRVLIHAGLGFDDEIHDWMLENVPGTPPQEALVHGAVIGAVTICDAIHRNNRDLGRWSRHAVGGGPHAPWGWVLRDAQQFATPVPVRGQLGLWEPPPAVTRAAVAQCNEREV